jgi:hypothetical protein
VGAIMGVEMSKEQDTNATDDSARLITKKALSIQDLRRNGNNPMSK